MTRLGRHRGVEEELEFIRKLSGRMRWVVSTTPRPLDPRQTPSTHCTRGRVRFGADLDGSRKVRPTPREFDSRTVQPVNGLRCPGRPPLAVVMRKTRKASGIIDKEETKFDLSMEYKWATLPLRKTTLRSFISSHRQC